MWADGTDDDDVVYGAAAGGGTERRADGECGGSNRPAPRAARVLMPWERAPQPERPRPAPRPGPAPAPAPAPSAPAAGRSPPKSRAAPPPMQPSGASSRGKGARTARGRGGPFAVQQRQGAKHSQRRTRLLAVRANDAPATFAEQVAALPARADEVDRGDGGVGRGELPSQEGAPPPWQSPPDRVRSPAKQRGGRGRARCAVEDIGGSSGDSGGDSGGEGEGDEGGGEVPQASRAPDCVGSGNRQASEAPPAQPADVRPQGRPAAAPTSLIEPSSSPTEAEPTDGAMGFLAHLGDEVQFVQQIQRCVPRLSFG